MWPLVENILVGAIVAGAALWAVRAMWQSRKQGTGCGACSQSGSCASTGQESKSLPLQDLTVLEDRLKP